MLMHSILFGGNTFTNIDKDNCIRIRDKDKETRIRTIRVERQRARQVDRQRKCSRKGKRNHKPLICAVKYQINNIKPIFHSTSQLLLLSCFIAR